MGVPTNTYEKGVSNVQGQAQLWIKSMLTLEKVAFPAFLSTFTQTFSSNWSTEEVYGRNDPIATFQGTKRSISLAFDVPSHNVASAKASLGKCNMLAQFLYPGYLKTRPTTAKHSPGKIISRPPLVKVKFANLIAGNNGSDGLLGYLSGLELNPSLEMGMFQDGGSFYPKVIALSFTLNVLHQDDLGFGPKAKKAKKKSQGKTEKKEQNLEGSSDYWQSGPNKFFT